jgi:hypothetical protein
MEVLILKSVTEMKNFSENLNQKHWARKEKTSENLKIGQLQFYLLCRLGSKKSNL